MSNFTNIFKVVRLWHYSKSEYLRFYALRIKLIKNSLHIKLMDSNATVPNKYGENAAQ